MILKHTCFIELEAHDRENRNKPFEVLKDKDVNSKIRRVFKNIYEETKIKVQIENKLSDYVTINREVR